MSMNGRDTGLSEVIGIILLLGIISAAFALWMMYVVPINGRDAEITQMNSVKDWFTGYKMSLDSLWINNQSGITLSSSLNLGTGGSNSIAGGLFLPMLDPIASSATISVKDDGDQLIVNSSSGTSDFASSMSMLEYQTMNNYWIQQRYYYQNGGVFLSQYSDTICRISPPVTIARVYNGTVDVASVNIVPIQLLGGSSTSGKGPVRVDSTSRTPVRIATLQENSWVKISVNVSDISTARMWMGVLNDTRIRGNITDSTWYSFNVTEDPVSKRGSATMTITGPYESLSSPDVYLTAQKADYLVILNNIASGIS